jgi:hypothetical protein
MSPNKISGYILILAGLAIIIFAIHQSYQIFTGKIQVPQFFVSSGKPSAQSPKIGDAQSQAQDAILKQLENILPSDSVFQLMNSISWSILVIILIFGGGQIAGLGIKLMAIKESAPSAG